MFSILIIPGINVPEISPVRLQEESVKKIKALYICVGLSR
jgi:hypothetical protein